MNKVIHVPRAATPFDYDASWCSYSVSHGVGVIVSHFLVFSSSDRQARTSFTFNLSVSGTNNLYLLSQQSRAGKIHSSVSNYCVVIRFMNTLVMKHVQLLIHTHTRM